MTAASEGDTDAVQTLLEKGVNVNAEDEHGQTALMRAAFNGRMGVAQLLLAKGADVNARGKEGQTALMVASESGHPDVIQALLMAGADVNAKMYDGPTALRLEEKNGQVGIVRLLEEAGAMGEDMLKIGSPDTDTSEKGECGVSEMKDSEATRFNVTLTNRRSGMQICPHCKTRVLPKTDDTCPACRRKFPCD
jgi:ankyrin repeat protein